MARLNVKYLGFELNSPLIVSSSRLTSKLELLKEAEDKGAGAVVLKSLFEEQISHYISSVPDFTGYPEAADYIANYTRANSVEEYLNLVRQAKESLSIPVIPSINCYSSGGWTEFAREIAKAGADALEINVFNLPVDKNTTSEQAEKVYYEIVEKLKKELNIPVAVKLGIRFSNILNLIGNLYNRGVKGVVMFNRFYEPDIDIDNLNVIPSQIFSHPDEKRYVMRWIAMASSQDIKIDISASTGVHSSGDAIKYLLAGSDTVQVCSVLYSKGLGFIETMNSEISAWMDRKGFDSINDFRGSLNYRNLDRPVVWERTQFMKYFSTED